MSTGDCVMEYIVEEVEVTDDVEQVFDEDDVSNVRVRFSSPESRNQRLNMLSEKLKTVINNTSEETIMRALLNELIDRTRLMRNTHNKTNIENMWTHIVLNNCFEFNYLMFRRSTLSHIDVPEEIMNYMKTTDIMSIIQLMVDLSQEKAYNCKDKLEEVKNSNIKDKTELEFLLIRTRELMKRYREYVTLIKKCNGSYRNTNNTNRNPTRIVKEKGNTYRWKRNVGQRDNNRQSRDY